MRKLFKVTDNKYNTDITEECYMDSDGFMWLIDDYDNDFINLQLPITFQKDHVKHPRYTVEKFI